MNLKQLTSVDYIVIHCSATKAHQNFTSKDIDLWHRKRGWLMIGYHVVILRDGSIQLGRQLDRQGAHVKGYNDCSLGVCMIGGVDDAGEPEDNFTEAQWNSLVFTLNLLQWKHPQSKIVGHYQLDPNKACPSFNPAEKGFR